MVLLDYTRALTLLLSLILSSTCLMAQNETSEMTDARDNQTYQTVKIGGQWWMSENLNFEKDSSWFFDNNENNGEKYGRLYTWQSAMSGCPAGWHLPTDQEWMTMESSIGMDSADLELNNWRGGENLLGSVSKGSELGWNNTTGHPTGLNLAPGGYYKQMIIAFAFKKNKFKDAGISGIYWTATAKTKRVKGDAYYRFINDQNPGIFRGAIYKQHAYSVRCVQDQ